MNVEAFEVLCYIVDVVMEKTLFGYWHSVTALFKVYLDMAFDVWWDKKPSRTHDISTNFGKPEMGSTTRTNAY